MIKANETVSADRVIELKELRIGGILSYKDSYVHVTLLSIDADDEYEDTIGFCLLGTNSKERSDWNRALAADLNRIPLTPEIIEKCGFERDEEEDCNGYQAHRPNTAHYAMSLFINDKGHVCAHYLGTAISTNHPQYLHQLQNLYFALTGEELNVQL